MQNRNSRKIREARKRLEKSKDDIARVTAVTILEWFNDAFQNQGWTDRNFDPWEKRKSGAPRNEGRNILIDSGVLQDSLQIIDKRWKNVEVGSVGVSYADIHNEGGTLTVPVTEEMRDFFWAKFHETGDDKWKAMALTPLTEFKIDIPQRQFIGDSDKMRKEINKEIRTLIDRKLRT